VSYQIAHGTPRTAAGDPHTVYDNQYESVLRSAFFHILAKYPAQSLATFLYFKPRAIVDTLPYAFEFHLKSANRFAAVASGLEFALFLGPSLTRMARSTKRKSVSATNRGVWLAFGVLSLAPYIVAWCNSLGSGMLVVFEFVGIIVVIGALAEQLPRFRQGRFDELPSRANPSTELRE
jgi:hypothetical protein